MTWGQLTQQAIYDFTGEESYRQTLTRAVDLPPGVPTQRIAAAVRTVLERHESLRTLYTSDRRQQVLAEAEFSMPVAAAGSGEDDRRVLTELRERSFGAADLPVQFGLLNHADGSASLLFSASHLAVDAFAADQLADELCQLCVSDRTDALPPPVGQPVDRTFFEQSPAGVSLSKRNIGRWLRLAEEGVSSTPAPRLPGLTPRFHTGRLESPRLGWALPRASARLGVSPAVLLLAGLSSALGEQFGIAKVASRIAFGNRADPRDHGIEALMQWGLSVIDVRAPAEAIARSAFRETMRAGAAARYDTYELFETLSGERNPAHQDFMPQAFLNYFDGATESPVLAVDDGTTDLESTFTTAPSHEHDSAGLYFVFAWPSPSAMTLIYMVDTRLLSLADLEASAWSLERYVLALAEAGH